MILIFYIVIFQSVICQKYFDFDYPFIHYPETSTIDDDSLFGFDIQPSFDNNKFYVSAPNSIYPSQPFQKVGSVFECERKDQICSQKFLPYQGNIFRSETSIKPLFGYSFAETSDGFMEICSPNIIFVIQRKYFCEKYNLTSSKIVENGIAQYRNVSSDKIFIDNYGIILRPRYINSTNEFIVGQYNYVYSSPIHSKSEYGQYLIAASSNGTTANFSLSNIPGNFIIINYNDDQNYFIVSYPDANYFIGSFVVWKNDLTIKEIVNVNKGTYGQQFGYSIEKGKFNSDENIDLLFGAPLNSDKFDQGAVYMYLYEQNTKVYNINPLIILGEDLPFARFGSSILNIGDRNYDNIEDFAILAPFFDKDIPRIYIYNPSLIINTLTFSHIIYLDSPTTHLKGFQPFKLIGNFDIDKNKILDLAISYPLENKFYYVMGIKYVNIDIKLNILDPLDDENNIIDISVSNETPLKKFKIVSIQLIFTLEHITDEEVAMRPTFEYNLSIMSREFSYFNTEGYPMKIMGHKSIEFSNSSIEIIFQVLYWLQPLNNNNYITLKIESKLKQNSLFCRSVCVKTGLITEIQNIYPTEYLCSDEKCIPQLDLIFESFSDRLKVGNINIRSFHFEINKTGIILSFFPTLEIIVPTYTSIITFNVSGINDTSEVSQQELDNFDSKKYVFTVQYDFSLSNRMTFDITFLLTPLSGIQTDSLEVSVYDAMYIYGCRKKHNIELIFEDNSIILSGFSTPQTIYITNSFNTFDISTNLLKMNVQIYNKQDYSRLMNVKLVLHLPLFFEENEILTIENISIPNMNKTNCTLDICSVCLNHILCYETPYILPNSLVSIDIILNVKPDIYHMISKNSTNLTASVRIFYYGVTKVLTKTLFIQTGIKFQIFEFDMHIYAYISIAAIIAGVILISIIYALYKTKPLNRIKSYFKENKKEFQ